MDTGRGREMDTSRYILQGQFAVEEPDLIKWAEWFGTADRTVGRSQLGDVVISTVFLDLNHQWGDGPPLLFETMVFGGDFSDCQARYTTWAEAERGHALAVQLVTGRLLPNPSPVSHSQTNEVTE